MRLSAIGMNVCDLDTPALLLNMSAFERNIATMAGRFKSSGIGWRPHAKAFKCPAIAHILRRSGAFGVTVAKVSEAEVMAAAGIEDILIANMIVGSAKTARLAALARFANAKACVDHIDQIDPMATAARAIGTTIGVLIEVDLGLNRCGASNAEIAAELARRVANSRGLRLDGVMGYEGHTLMIADPDEKRRAIVTALDRLIEARDRLTDLGLACSIVSAGGTGSYQYTADYRGISEIQAGGGVFACLYYTKSCGVKGHENSLTVLATVVGRPAADRAILDIGQKAISQHRETPVLRDHPETRILNLSAEHTVVSMPRDYPLKIGDKVHVIPGYSDFTFVLHDRVLAHRNDVVEASWELWGRGMLQ